MTIFNQTSEYAVRALIELARLEPGATKLARDLAAETSIPAHYLSKILQGLARVGILDSRKGIHGGFRLAMPATEINLYMVISPLENLGRLNECMLGQEVCSDARACPLHDFWSKLRQSYMTKLTTTTLKDLADFEAPTTATIGERASKAAAAKAAAAKAAVAKSGNHKASGERRTATKAAGKPRR